MKTFGKDRMTFVGVGYLKLPPGATCILISNSMAGVVSEHSNQKVASTKWFRVTEYHKFRQ